jgi:translocation and assembly module TamA
VNEEKIEGLDPGVMSRYWAFVLGAPYNGDLLTVTTHRVTDDALVQSTYFTASCQPEGAVLHQQSVAGPPRVVTIGLGVDTEQLIITRASWKKARLGDMGSSLSLTANASLKIQEFTADGNWYYHRQPKRSYLQPTLNIRHENEQHFENLTGRARFAPATTWDSQTLGVRASVGPTMTWTHTYRGEGPRDSQFLSLNANVHLFNHYYELYRDRPQTGFSATLDSDFAEHDWLSSVSARTIRGNLEGLLNVGSFDPPFLVFGFRGGLMTTFTDEKLSSATRLPSLFRQWLGGSTDLRGFGRQELPGKSGALTAMYAGIELRFADSLPFGLQPFVFADAGALGTESLSLDSPVFWDPGIGIRWQAPFGVIRATLAQGFMEGNTAGWDPKLKHPQFYFSFGEEF